MTDIVIGTSIESYYCNKCGRSHHKPEICPFVSKAKWYCKGMRSIGFPLNLMSQIRELLRGKRLNVGKTIQRGVKE